MKTYLTIVILVYKSEPYIRQLIDCLYAQTDKNFEIIIVDNASPDRSVKLAEEYLNEYNMKNYKVVHISKNTGCGQGRTVGYKSVTTEYIKFLDSDDLIVETYVEKINAEIEQSHADIIAYGHIVIDEHGNEIRRIEAANNSTIAKYALTMFWRYTFKKIIAEKADVNTSSMHYAEDRYFSMELMPYIKSTIVLKDYLYMCTRRSSSTTNSTNPEVFLESNLLILKRYGELYSQISDEYEKKIVFYQLTKFFVTCLIPACKYDMKELVHYIAIYKEKYLEIISESKMKCFWIIPKDYWCKETFIIQVAYLILRYKQYKFFMKIFRRY